jgi:RNA polymerase sigma-70 factor (ECF subfamily)
MMSVAQQEAGARVAAESQSDETLMEAFQRGDAKAFARLFARHQRPIFTFLCRSVGNDAVAEELVQELFLRVVKAAATYRRQAKLTTWLYTMARNLCIDQARRAKHRQAGPLDEEAARSSSAADGEQRAIDREAAARMERALATLPAEQREVFLLREQSNLKFRDIATIVEASESTVKSRMRYALEHLRRELVDLGGR